MTEAVILALITLLGVLIFSVSSIILAVIVLKEKPNHFDYWTGYGHLEVDYDKSADK